MKLLNEVLEDIKPSNEYERDILDKAKNIIDKINKSIKDAKAVLGGSGAKGTWLKTFDADIFVKFNYNKFKDKSDKLSDILEKFLKKNFKITKLHGSRDYFQIRQEKFTFEIVPILDIKKAEQARNITDVSPLHSNFVLKHKNLIDDMRLTKQFFKAAKVYGAESYIRGFSGYVCEILTIYYGSFLNLIKTIPKWKEKTVMDIKKFYKNKNILFEINKSKLTSPLVIIDPVQKERNAAAALDHEKFEIIKHRAKEFLKKPSKDFFEVKTLTEQDIRKKFQKNKLIILKAKPLNKKEDVAGAKMLKAFHFIEQKLISYSFKIMESDMLWHSKNSSLFYYILENDELTKTMEILGPPLKIKRHADAFKKKHKKTFIKNKKICATEKRKFTNAADLVKNIIKASNVKDNINKIELI
ncbi:MAG: CCA tRNA nucleotidyltransferase [Candidatus Woesearchaeota archaeon]|jgi:tRNA nucleotidyltransferase (CCA-adding enzyme)|nr:CCA tRNA nucleotidyltransferase [Candidatus Woesearchaeota archaeon]MDP6265850.1 CCA tRNA nucleotidyltransferase [Candidatus Woesearchaeota archaeon]MDP7322455.1 CCA tRNA nucleotidyltransferase [Candidatus Woesearchaeota archaeon]MDP7476278.1 CCA tRNA nucleotidyltransferase [Candidatus Woesearchaeota archaeon]HJO01950.1 CCA tRNA nucleotidyltransferase [Candidatus Woesearchaeota archaeon]|tara:strand:+ start:131 stop:1369 length:1239 start_codon:yes stop_codon:yes gene_type:complete